MIDNNTFIICEYCGILINITDNHIETCCPINNIDTLLCYSCGSIDQPFSNSQLQKHNLARCQSCVKNNITTKHMPHYSAAFDGVTNINTELYNSIANINYNQVKILLDNGANPNYIVQDFVRVNGKYRALYNSDRSEKAANDPTQPFTPIKLCIFRFSDCTLIDNDQLKLIEIAKLLIAKGADCINACQYFKSRYGNVTNRADSDIWKQFYNLLLLAGNK